MADIEFHPSARTKIIARLGEIEAQKAMARTGLLHLLNISEFAASTAVNAEREGITVREMHRRGVTNLIVKLEAEAVQLRDQLRRCSKPDVGSR